jgi:ABC-2 type transport system permease protein
MMAFRFGFVLSNIWLYPIAFVALVLFTTAVCMWVSALNVRYRDVQHLLGLALLVWFWMTPIVYSAHPVQTKLSEHSIAGVSLWHVFLANPVAWIVFGFQRALYHAPKENEVLVDMSTGQLAVGLGVMIAVSAALCYLTWRAFFSFSGDFAEEL